MIKKYINTTIQLICHFFIKKSLHNMNHGRRRWKKGYLRSDGVVKQMWLGVIHGTHTEGSI